MPKTPLSLSMTRTTPPRGLMRSAHRGPASTPTTPQLQACSLGGGDSLSRPQPQPLLLTPTPAAGISAQMARPRATLFAYFLFCPDPETLPSSRWAHSSSFSLPSLEPRLQVSCLLPPLPADGPRQLHTHWATGGGGIWSQGEVRESPPFQAGLPSHL